MKRFPLSAPRPGGQTRLRAGGAIGFLLFWALLLSPAPAAAQAGKRPPAAKPEPRQSPASWSRTFGGKSLACGYGVQQTRDGGYIVTGSLRPDPKADQYLWVLKLDPLGNKVWDRTFSGGGQPSTGGSAGYAVQQTSDGGFALAGVKSSSDWAKKKTAWDELWILRLDPAGNTVWERSFDGRWSETTSAAEGHSVWQTADGGFLVGGMNGRKGLKGYLLKLDPEGNRVWDRFLEELSPTGTPRYTAAVPTPDGGAAMTYMTLQNRGGVRIVRVDPWGAPLWQRTLRHPERGGDDSEEIKSLSPTGDRGFILAGSMGSSNWYRRSLWLVKLDENGRWQWDRLYSRSLVETAESVEQAEDGGYLVTGWSQGDSRTGGFLVLRLDRDGNTLWSRNFGSPGSPGRGFAARRTRDGGFVAAGMRGKSHTAADLWVLKMDEKGYASDREKGAPAPGPFQIKRGEKTVTE